MKRKSFEQSWRETSKEMEKRPREYFHFNTPTVRQQPQPFSFAGTTTVDPFLGRMLAENDKPMFMVPGENLVEQLEKQVKTLQEEMRLVKSIPFLSYDAINDFIEDHPEEFPKEKSHIENYRNALRTILLDLLCE